MKKIFKYLIVVIVLVCMCFLFIKNTIVRINDFGNIFLFFITINSILCGFSTNNESKILSVTSESIIQELRGCGIIAERERLVSINFKFSVVSISLSSALYLILILGILKNIVIFKIATYVLIVLTIVGVSLFIKSSSKIKSIIKIVYDDRCPFTKEELENMRDDIEKLH